MCVSQARCDPRPYLGSVAVDSLFPADYEINPLILGKTLYRRSKGPACGQGVSTTKDPVGDEHTRIGPARHGAFDDRLRRQRPHRHDGDLCPISVLHAERFLNSVIVEGVGDEGNALSYQRIGHGIYRDLGSIGDHLGTYNNVHFLVTSDLFFAISLRIVFLILTLARFFTSLL